MDAQNIKRTVRNLTIFTFLVIALPWLGRGLDSLAGRTSSEEGPGLLIWIITPCAVSLLLRAFAGDGWQDLGLRPAFKGNGLWYAASILVYPICIALVLVIGLVIGGISFPDASSDPAGTFVQAFALALVPQFIINILEEFGFRGYLAPKMYKLGLNDFVAHATVGLIWGAWHLPYFSYVTSYTTESPATLVPRFLVGTMAASIFYGEIRILTHSMWPAVLTQTIGGALLTGILSEDLIKTTSGMEFLVSPVVEGGLVIVLFTLIGVGIRRLRKKSTRSTQTWGIQPT
jgi:membrane protease YdiL (CAAX protease family)